MGTEGTAGERIRSVKKFGPGGGQAVLCRNCGKRIASLESAVTVDEKHLHRFTNPSGITYEICCFAAAEGCVIQGEPTLEFTWFEDFSWRTVFCSGCLTHLGWFYQSGKESFYGLILDQLKAGEPL